MFKDTFVLSTIIFVISLLLCYLPSKIRSVGLLKKIYPYITIAASGFMLAMLLMDFIPHLSGTCTHQQKERKNHTFKECPDALVCDIHKKDILSTKKKSDDHCSHHNHKHAHSEFTFFIKNFGFFIAGISFIFLLSIDSLLLQHSHCDNEDVVYMNDGINHGAHQHEYCHLHGERDETIEKSVECQMDEHSHKNVADCKNTYETDNQKREKEYHTQETGIDQRSNEKDHSQTNKQNNDHKETRIDQRSNEKDHPQTSKQNNAYKETRIDMKLNEKDHFHLDGSCNTSALKDKKGKLQAMIFIIALSIHSLFEGFAIKTNEIGIFEIGIILHKALESFALGFTVWMAAFSYNYKLILMTVYSLLTPLGMFISFFLQRLPFSNTSHRVQHLIKATCNGLALGSILFIVCVEMIPPNFHTKGANFSKIFTLCSGYLLTCLVIYFIH